MTFMQWLQLWSDIDKYWTNWNKSTQKHHMDSRFSPNSVQSTDIFQNACESSPFSVRGMWQQKLKTGESSGAARWVQLVLQRSLPQRQHTVLRVWQECIWLPYFIRQSSNLSPQFLSLLISGWILRKVKRWNTSSSTLCEMALTACVFSKAGLNKSKQAMSVRGSLPVYFHKLSP